MGHLDYFSGIYQIEKISTGERYIGRSNQLEVRRAFHISSLKRGDHKSKLLQKAWDDSDPSDFRFTVLENCLPRDLKTRELNWINRLSPEFNKHNKRRFQ